MVFKPKERRIFKFFDGSRNRGIDPLEADIALEAVDLDWEAQFTQMQLGKAAAATAIVDAARAVFKLAPYELADDGSESGLTASEVLDLLGNFIVWRADTRNFIAPPATSQPSTDGVAALTESGTASTSTSTEKSSVAVSP